LEILTELREALLAAEVVVDHAGGREGGGVHDPVVGGALDAQLLAGMVVEREVHALHVGQVGRDVRAGDLDLAVLHVLRMGELDVAD